MRPLIGNAGPARMFLVASGVLCACLVPVILQHNIFSGSHDWSYDDPATGPSEWPIIFPHDCAGQRQSPIAMSIQCADDVIDNTLQFVGYDTPGIFEMKNNGHSVQVMLPPNSLELSGGRLDGRYEATQFHFHWGNINSRGSEHTLDGVHYAAEMHIVHTWKGPNSAGASQEGQGMAVLAVLIQVGDHNPSLDAIVNSLGDISLPGQSTHTHQAVSLDGLLPTNRADYFRYHGSLTTPPCTENVVWTVFSQHIQISQDQLDAFRKVTAGTHPLVDNFRPVQSLNERKPIHIHKV